MRREHRDESARRATGVRSGGSDRRAWPQAASSLQRASKTSPRRWRRRQEQMPPAPVRPRSKAPKVQEAQRRSTTRNRAPYLASSLGWFAPGGYDVLQADAASASCARRPLADQFQSGTGEGAGQLHQRIDITADHALTGFHSLNGGHRKTTQFRKLARVESEEASGGPQLGGG